MIWETKAEIKNKEDGKILSRLEANVGPLKIIIANDHYYFLGQWVLTCKEVGIPACFLKADILKEAKKEALWIVYRESIKFEESFQEIKEEYITTN